MHAKKYAYSNLPTQEKVKYIISWLIDKKAMDMVALDLSREAGPTEAVIIVTANSARHGQGLADHILQSARNDNFEYMNMEGYIVGQWILLDLNDVVVHIFQPESRQFFRLDELWPSAGILADTRKEI
ncbi:MAG: ribosome silencing factor [Desulfovibrio sp.]|nr:ribosome silencing factor [Desulfovibrio sp.]